MPAGCWLRVDLPASVPATATAVALTITADRAAEPGFLTAHPCGSSLPLLSNVNVNTRGPTSNLALVGLDATHAVCIYSSGRTDVIVDIDLPGIDPNSIDITVERNHLSLRAERHRPTRDGDVVLASGRRHGQFRRDLYLGESLDSSRIQAQYDNGVLTLTVPLAEHAQPRKVSVGQGASQPVEVESHEA